MLAALAEGTTRLDNFSTGKDCASTLDCLRELGCRSQTTRKGETLSVEIHGTGMNLQAPQNVLNCGNSGSTIRMMSGILAGQAFESEMTGDESLSRRPMARVMKPLAEMGASITAAEGSRPPPANLRGEVARNRLRNARGERTGGGLRAFRWTVCGG